jgi:hypothetical protein
MTVHAHSPFAACRYVGQDCILRAGFQPALPARRTQRVRLQTCPTAQRDRYHPHAAAWNQFAIRTRGSVAAEGYGRSHAGARIEGVPFQPQPIGSAAQLGRAKPDKRWNLTDYLPVNRRSELEQSPEIE